MSMSVRWYTRRYVFSSIQSACRSPLCYRRAFVTSTPARVEAPEQDIDPSDAPESLDLSKYYEPNAAVLDYVAKRHAKNAGSPGTMSPFSYNPDYFIDHPPQAKDITLELLLASQSHFGHSVSLWNPANSRYIFGVRSGIHIISLDVTAQHLRRAARVVSAVAERSGLILFVGTKSGFERPVVNAAKLAAPACHLFSRWIPGTITNSSKILANNHIKVVDDLDNHVDGLEFTTAYHKPLSPDLVVCLNPIENYNLLHECALSRIPTIGVIDTNADPTWVTYPIPANDDSIRCISLISGVLGHAARQGQQKRKAAALKGYVPQSTPSAWFNLPQSFDPIKYMQRRDHLNPGQLRRDVEAKLTSVELSALAAGQSVIDIGDLDKRLRPDEILTLRRAYEPGFVQPTKTDQDSKSFFESPEEKEKRAAEALSDVSDLATEAAHRAAQASSPAQGRPVESPTSDADLNGDPWDSPSAVVARNENLGLTPAELQILAADKVDYYDLAGLSAKIPVDLYAALVAELKMADKVAHRFSDDDDDDFDEDESDDDDDDDEEDYNSDKRSKST